MAVIGIHQQHSVVGSDIDHGFSGPDYHEFRQQRCICVEPEMIRVLPDPPGRIQKPVLSERLFCFHCGPCFLFQS